MKKHQSLFALSVLLLTACFANAQKVQDYLQVPGPIKFDGINYNLRWTSHPGKTLFMQEYIPAGESLEHYKKMFLLQALYDTIDIPTLIARQVKDLEQKKKTDIVVNYKLLQNNKSNEYLLDFVLSDGKDPIGVVEWNAYRYKYIYNVNGNKIGVLLAGISIREYDGIEKFLKSLHTLREKMIPLFGKFLIPEIHLEAGYL